ncbi:unnamed protein product [Larinioides sclopetarius]|uniref:RNA (guanine-9-)-methyltransferase domain-containing protein 1 n=1 Tax=Larinioides sclopetarius TaxID=280406 RepID=A0AAV2BAW9_9ARAC
MNNFCRKLFVLKLFRSNGEIFCRQFSNSLIPWKSKSSFNLIHQLRSKEIRFVHTGVCLRSVNTGQELLENKEESPDCQQNEELDFKVAKYADLATDLEKKKKILMILMEHEVSKLEGRKVPSKISIEDMKELLSTYSYSSRVKYMRFLAEKECKRIAERRRKETKIIEREKWLIEKENLKPAEHIQYGIGHNTMVVRVRRSSIFRYAYQRLANSVLYGQKVVVDLDFDCFMRKQDCNNCGEQLLELYSANRKNVHPFDLTFCNADINSQTMSAFRKYMPNLYAPDNFITVTDMSYLDIYPKEKLVYITPYAKEPLKVYDHNAIYIIGGLVDKCIREPVVLAKAKREQIRAVHLPYDEYLMWGRGNKSLPLNHILGILLEMKNTNDWKKAFRYVPQRKLVRSLDLYAEYS